MKHILLHLFILSSTFLYGQTQRVEVFFENARDELTVDAQKELDQFLNLDNSNSIEIVGYTDSTGSRKFNSKLSLNRAKSVEKYLIDNGKSASQISRVSGEGESLVYPSLRQNRVVIIKYVIVEPIELPDQVEPDPDRNIISEKPKQEVNETDHRLLTRDGELDQSTIESLKVGEILNLGGIEFQPGRHILTRRSERPLEKLIKILKDNPDLKIEIQGHICCQADHDGLDKDTGTMNLSENRAITIYKELIKAGIDKNRLTYKGYGPFRKLVAEFDDNSRQRNRRVSIQILSK